MGSIRSAITRHPRRVAVPGGRGGKVFAPRGQPRHVAGHLHAKGYPMRPSLAAFLLCLLALAAGALANGAYFPPIAVTDPPTIPMQTALIRHEQGVETLVVESNPNAPAGDSFAWVLPLPAAPTSMEPAGASTLTTLRALVGREVVTGWGDMTAAWVIILGIVSFVLSVRPWLYRNSKRSIFSVGGLLALLALIAVLAAIAVPNFLGSEGAGPLGQGVDVLKREAVGSYDVAVLKAEGAAPLEAWLAGNGYAPLGAGREAAAQAYAKEGWVFLAMKIRRDAGVPLEAHPLKVVFPTDKSIFPMRLTAAPGQKTDVAIFLVGKVPYYHPLFETEFRKRVKKGEAMWDYDRKLKIDVLRIAPRAVLIANQDAVAMVDHQDWVTRLQATLDEGQMKDDIVPVAMAPGSREVRRKVYARGLVVTWTWGTALAGLFLMAPLASWLASKRRLRPGMAAAMGVAILGATAGVYFSHAKVDDFEAYSSIRGTQGWQVARGLAEALKLAPKPPREDRAGRRQLIDSLIAKHSRENEQGAMGGFKPGRGPMQYYHATGEDGRDLVRFVLASGAVTEVDVEELFVAAEKRPTP